MAAHKLQGRMKLYGFEISVENAKGSVRRWYDPHGKEKGHTKMHFDYGYIRGTKGTDGDHVDVYVGPNPESDRVFIVNQMKKPPVDTDGAWTRFDEQKVMLAFKDAAAAKAAYLKQYDDPRFFGGMKEMSVDDFKTKVMARENHGKKIAQDAARLGRLYAELNLARLAGDEPIVMPKLAKSELLGEGTPGISTLPAITNYAQATMSKQERKEADREMKTSGLSHTHETTRGLSRKAIAEGKRVEAEHTDDPNTARQIAIDHLHEDTQYYEKLKKVEKHAADDRVSRIADRVDDVGLAMLGAPSAAYLTGSVLKRLPSAKARAAGVGLQHGVEKLRAGVHHGVEAAGLALVSPTVSHAIARKIDEKTKKANGDMAQYFMDHPEKLKEKQERDRAKKAELEKIAQSIFSDYEYKTESEKTAIIAMLGRMGGLASRAGKAVSGGARAATAAAGQAAGRASSGLSSAVARAGDKLKGGFIAGERGVSQAVGERAARMARTPGSAISKVPAVTPPASVAKGGVPTPVPTTTAAPAASAAAPRGSGKWNPLSARNLVLAGGGAALGLGAYGGYKGIQTASNLLQTHHEAPLAPPGFAGTGRVF